MESIESSGINTVVICPNINVRNALIRAIQVTGGAVPTAKSDSDSATRAHYPPAETRVIINTASASMHERLGPHSVALAVIAVDRVVAAERAREIFKEYGIVATVHRHAEPEFPPDFLTFVTAPELGGIVLMFWPRDEDVSADLISVLPKREPWTDDDIAVT